MKKNVWIGLLIAALCLLLCLPAALAEETRQGVIALEGQEETIEETLFESPLGFSFWYAGDWLDAYCGEKDNIDGVIVDTDNSDDFMVLFMIPEEDAAEYTEDFEINIADLALDGRVQMDVYRDLEEGRYYFLTVIAEKDQYLCAVGEYAEEAAEGNAKFFQRVLDSVAFTSECLIHADWGIAEEDRVQVILMAMEPVTDVKLLRLVWDEVAVTWEEAASLGSLDKRQSVTVTLQFVGLMPENGVQYTDAAGEIHAFALDISGEDGTLLFWKLGEKEE